MVRKCGQKGCFVSTPNTNIDIDIDADMEMIYVTHVYVYIYICIYVAPKDLCSYSLQRSWAMIESSCQLCFFGLQRSTFVDDLSQFTVEGEAYFDNLPMSEEQSLPDLLVESW